MSFLDDAAPEPAAPAPRDLVTSALELVGRMTAAELAAFRKHLRFPVRPGGAEQPEALARNA